MQCVLFTPKTLMHMLFCRKKKAIQSRFEVLIFIKIPSLMLIFHSYITICSQAIRIIRYQHEKRYLIKKKTFKNTPN